MSFMKFKDFARDYDLTNVLFANTDFSMDEELYDYADFLHDLFCECLEMSENSTECEWFMEENSMTIDPFILPCHYQWVRIAEKFKSMNMDQEKVFNMHGRILEMANKINF